MLKNVHKITKKAAALTLAASLFIAPNALALNSNGSGAGTGSKPLDVSGYSLTLSSNLATDLNVYFDKSVNTSQVEAQQFVVQPVNGDGSLGTAVSLSIPVGGIQTGTGKSGVTSASYPHLDKGTTVDLRFASSLTANQLYNITMKGTIMDGDGTTLGNYNNHGDFSFKFLTPNSTTGYYNSSQALNVKYSLGTSNVPFENNLVLIYDRPMQSSSVSSFRTSLISNYTNTTKGAQVAQDSNYSDTTQTSNYECYQPVVNDANNTFFFPETLNTTSYAVYDRDYSNNNGDSYTLTLPTFYDTQGNALTNPANLSFSTIDTHLLSDHDLPSFWNSISSSVNYPPTVSQNSNEGIDVSWLKSTVTPQATSFDVYYWDATLDTTHDKFTGSYTADSFDSITGSGTSLDPYKITLTDTALSGGPLTANDTYYIRIVPKNTVGSVGFSMAGSAVAK